MSVYFVDYHLQPHVIIWGKADRRLTFLPDDNTEPVNGRDTLQVNTAGFIPQ